MSILNAAVKSFEENAAAVRKLLEFDRFVMDVAINQLQKLEQKTNSAWSQVLRRLGDVKEGSPDPPLNPGLSVRRTTEMLRRIREHDSLKGDYEVMTNQALVLLVSYFGSAVRDVVRAAVTHAVTKGRNEELLRFEIRVRVEDLRELDRPIHAFIGDQFVEAPDVSFQDMKSIARTIKTYFGVESSRDAVINDIVTSQACRHAIVHSGLTADQRLLGQLTGARPRNIKPSLKLGDRIQFSSEEVMQVKTAMSSYLATTAAAIEASLHTTDSNSDT